MNTFERRIVDYQRNGWVLLTHTSNTAQLRRPKDNPGCVPLIFLFLLSIVCGILFLIFRSLQREEIVTLTDELGYVREISEGGGWGVGPWIIVAIFLNLAIVAVAIVICVLIAGVADSLLSSANLLLASCVKRL